MRVNYALNLTLFVSMTSAMISGFMISKVVLPVHPAADEYLNWHSIHKTSSRIALAAVGLHLCLNWDLMLAALRNFVRRRASRSSRLRTPVRPLIARVAIKIVVVTVIGAALYAEIGLHRLARVRTAGIASNRFRVILLLSPT
jgi:hypothetical protein